jgi:hypothetical protein
VYCCIVIILKTLFSNTLNLRSSFSVRDHVSHPYKTTGDFPHPQKNFRGRDSWGGGFVIATTVRVPNNFGGEKENRQEKFTDQLLFLNLQN